MKILKIIFVLFLFLGCQKTIKEHLAIGTWTKCFKNGSYSEYKIKDGYMLMLTSGNGPDAIWIFKNKILDSIMIVSNFKNGNTGLPYNDTLRTLSYSKHKIIFTSNGSRDNFELSKANFVIEDIDSTNFELWKSKTLSEFKIRYEIVNCPDLRTEDEKIIPDLGSFDYEEVIEDIPLEDIILNEVKDSIN